jgi:hypothetical protein
MNFNENEMNRGALVSFFRKIDNAPAPYEDQDEIITDSFQRLTRFEQVRVLLELISVCDSDISIRDFFRN